jgi:hypothetical protein
MLTLVASGSSPSASQASSKETGEGPRPASQPPPRTKQSLLARRKPNRAKPLAALGDVAIVGGRIRHPA